MASFPAGSLVVGVDGSDPSEAALAWAVDEAVARQLPLHLVHAREDAERWLTSEPGQILSAAVVLAEEMGPGLSVTGEAVDAPPAAALIERTADADAVVVGARGRGPLRGVLLGSVSRQVAEDARCPVIVAHDRARRLEQRQHVVVGVDGSSASGYAMEYAFTQAERRGVGLTAFHAWWPDQSEGSLLLEGQVHTSKVTDKHQRVLSEAVSLWRRKYPGVPVRERAVLARPTDALVAASSTAALLVVGARGMGGVRGLMLGSVSHRVMERTRCPVAIVHPPQD